MVADPATTVAMTLTIDYLKASDNKIYAPFTVTVQPDVIGKGASLAAYVRLAPKGAAPPAAPPPLDPKAKKEKEKQDKKKKGKEAQDLAGQAVSGVEYPWEDFYDLTAVPRGPGGPLTFSRPFSVRGRRVRRLHRGDGERSDGGARPREGGRPQGHADGARLLERRRSRPRRCSWPTR